MIPQLSPNGMRKFRSWLIGIATVGIVILLLFSITHRGKIPSVPIPSINGDVSFHTENTPLTANSTYERDGKIIHYIDEPTTLERLWTTNNHHILVGVTDKFNIEGSIHPYDLLLGKDHFASCEGNSKRINDFWFYVYKADRSESTTGFEKSRFGISPCAAWKNMFPTYPSRIEDMIDIEEGDLLYIALSPEEHDKFTERNEEARVEYEAQSIDPAPTTSVRLFPMRMDQKFGTSWWQGGQWYGDVRPIDEGAEKAAEFYDHLRANFSNEYGRNTDPASTAFAFSRVPDNMTGVDKATARLVMHPYGDFPDHLRFKIVGSISEDLTSWTDIDSLSYSSMDMVSIPLDVLPNKPIASWKNLQLIMEGRWDPCPTVYNCHSYQLDFMLHAVDLMLDLRCEGECEDVSPVCGNGVIEYYNQEVCDDGNREDRDHCDNACKKTKNWWIDELNIPGPVSPWREGDMAEGSRVVLPSGNVVQAWVAEYVSSFGLHQSLFVSTYANDAWSVPVKLNEGLGMISGYTKIPTFFSDREDRVFAFLSPQSGGFYRGSAEGGWLPLRSIGERAGMVQTSDVGDDNLGILLYEQQVPISSDLRNDPYFGRHLASYTYDQGLFALPYRDGEWGTPILLKTLYHTRMWQNAVRANPHANVPRSTAKITSRTGTVYSVEWYQENLTVNVAE